MALRTIVALGLSLWVTPEINRSSRACWVDDKQAISTLDDPQLWLLRDQLLDAEGKPIGSIWQATSSILNFAACCGHDERHARLCVLSLVTHSYDVPLNVDRLTMRVRFSPIDLAVLDDLIASGDLDPSLRDAQPIWDLSATHLEWTSPLGYTCVTQ
ncbi:MAG: hypothetical protein U0165_18590 [Polyangiaceae bacterium]